MLYDEEETRRRLWNWCFHHSSSDAAESRLGDRDLYTLQAVMEWAEFLETLSPKIVIPDVLRESAARYIALPVLDPKFREFLEAGTPDGGFDVDNDLKYPAAYAFPDELYELGE